MTIARTGQRFGDDDVTARWASKETARGDFEALHAGLTVNLIGTSRADLMTCQEDETVAEVMARNTEPYDVLPVVAADAGKQIIGIFHARQALAAAVGEARIKDRYEALSEATLVGADSSILEFVTEADRRPCRLVVSGGRIVGLVTLSDLQKLPVRATLFALITGFEMTMAEAIRAKFGDGEDWMACLSAGRKEKINAAIERARRKHSLVNSLLLTQFCDKAEIVAKALALPQSKSALRKRLNEIQDLRNNLAHASDYAATPNQARMTCALVRDLLALRKEITAACPTDAAGGGLQAERRGAA